MSLPPVFVQPAFVHLVMSPKELSLSADRERTSSAPLVLLTSALYLTVAQAAVVLTTPLVTIAVLGASVDVTVTLLDGGDVNVELVFNVEWTDAVTVSVNPARFSPTIAVKEHVPVAPGAASGPGGQLTLVAVIPEVPAAQAVPVNVRALKIVPYALSQIWSIARPPAVEVLVIATV